MLFGSMRKDLIVICMSLNDAPTEYSPKKPLSVITERKLSEESPWSTKLNF